MSLGPARGLSPNPPCPCPGPHQRNDEALRELQEVPPQQCGQHPCRPLLLQALEQPLEQGLVAAQVRGVLGVQAWWDGGAAVLGGPPTPPQPAPFAALALRILPLPRPPTQSPRLGPGEAHTWFGVEGLQPRGLFQLDLFRKTPYKTGNTGGRASVPVRSDLGGPEQPALSRLPGPRSRGQASLTRHLGLPNAEDVGPVLECLDKERVCDSEDHVGSRERRERRGGGGSVGSRWGRSPEDRALTGPACAW